MEKLLDKAASSRLVTWARTLIGSLLEADLVAKATIIIRKSNIRVQVQRLANDYFTSFPEVKIPELPITL